MTNNMLPGLPVNVGIAFTRHQVPKDVIDAYCIGHSRVIFPVYEFICHGFISGVKFPLLNFFAMCKRCWISFFGLLCHA